MKKILIILFALILILNGCLVLYICLLKQKINGLLLQKASKEREVIDWKNQLLEKVKEKIVITEQTQMQLNNADDILSSIYQQNDIKQLGEDLHKIFSNQINRLCEQYPQLTDLDILVICLLGIEMDNLEICALLRMEKRTLYRRRQLIAKRMGISSLQLDDFAFDLLSEQLN